MKFMSTRFLTSVITFVAYFKVYLKNNSDGATIAQVSTNHDPIEERNEDRSPILDNIHTHVVSVPDSDTFLNQHVYKQFYHYI